MPDQSTIENALTSNAWPFQEAEALLKRLNNKLPAKGYVLFETGYGPSGLPHIGTFGEVARTTMVRKAFEMISGMPTKLFAFSDDMDGLRKVPDNLPNHEMIRANLGKPLTAIPDPFGTHASFGHHMNARLRAFLDGFNFEYEFKSATDCYKSGEFDKALLATLKNYDAIMEIIMPTLGDERQQTYSPFLPVCPKTGHVLQVAVTDRDEAAGTITYTDPNSGESIVTPVTGGHCKLQWKADWAMRWFALDVDYEMCGKDLIPSYELSSRIETALGGTPPQNMVYELFLDEKGQKISKSKGNGLTLEQWLRYAPPESLSLYMFQSPRKAKRLYFDVIPRQVDDYLTFVEKFANQDEKARFANPAWHIHNGTPPASASPISFALLLNLASACNPEDASVLWGFISRYAPDVTPENCPFLDRLVGHAVHYYRDFVEPEKKFRPATAKETAAMTALSESLNAAVDKTPEALQQIAYDIGKDHYGEDLRGWFQALYEVLLGQSQGPRIGSFIALYGIEETLALISRSLNRQEQAA